MNRESMFSPLGIGFAAVDIWRRRQGRALDRIGLGAIETPHRIAWSEPGAQLRAYGAPCDGAPALLIVAAPIKRPYVWDLIPSVSVVRRCLEAGFAVYLLEWTDPEAGAEIGLDDIVGRIGRALDAVAAETGAGRPALAGHSIGGTLAAIAVALYPERADALVLVEAPLKFGPDAGALAPLMAAAPPGFEDAARDAPGSFLAAASAVAAPAEFYGWRGLDRLRSLTDPEAWAIHVRIERWTLDEFTMPGRLFAGLVNKLYREDRLARSALTIGGRTVRPEALGRVPILAVVDPESEIVPPASALGLLTSISCGFRVLEYEGDVGVCLRHVGPLVGRNAHARLWPEILAWLRRPTSTPR